MRELEWKIERQDSLTKNGREFFTPNHFPKKSGFRLFSVCKEDFKTTADTKLSNKEVTKACIFFNNTAAWAAIKNATWLKRYISAH